MTKPAPPSQTRVVASMPVGYDPAGLPVFARRLDAAALRLTLVETERGRNAGRVGIDLAVLGTVAPAEVEGLIADFLTVRDAAVSEQHRRDTAEEYAAEVAALASGCTVAELVEMTERARGVGNDSAAALYVAAREARVARAALTEPPSSPEAGQHTDQEPTR